MKNASLFFRPHTLLLFLFLSTFTIDSHAQVGYDPNNFYSASNKPPTPGDEKGDKNGWNIATHPHNTSSPSVPIDNHIWLLLLGGGGLIWYYSRRVKKIPSGN